MKNILSLLLLLLAFTACGDKKAVTDVLNRAEAVMNEFPDSALNLLRTLTSDDFRKEKNRARYALLHSQALDKNYIDVTSDSIISVAVDYYQDEEDVRNKFLSYYYMGRVHANGERYLQATSCLMESEQLVEEDGKLYVVNSGWGYDNRLSIIDLRTFESAEHVTIMTNPQRIIEVDDCIFIQGYGAAYPDPYTYPVQLYDRQTKTVSTIGQGTHMAEYGNKLYVAYCSTADWVNYTTTFYTYDTRTRQKSETSFLKDAPAELTTGNVYMLEVNPENGDIYVGVTYYAAGEGDIYRFKADGTFVGKFESGGQGPNAMVFFE